MFAKLKDQIAQKTKELADLEHRVLREKQKIEKKISTRRCPQCKEGAIVMGNLPNPWHREVTESPTCDNPECLATFTVRVTYLPEEDKEEPCAEDFEFNIGFEGFLWESWAPEDCSTERLFKRIERRSALPETYNTATSRQNELDFLEILRRVHAGGE